MTRCQPSHSVSITMSKSARGRGTEELSLFSGKSRRVSPLAFVRDPGPVPLSPNLVPELHLGHGDESERSPSLSLVCAPRFAQEGAEVTTPTDLLCAIPLKRLVLIAIMLLFACPSYGKRKDDVVT